MATLSPRRWLSQSEAAEYLGVTTRTIRNYIASGDLPARRVSGSRLIRIAADDLDELLKPIPSAKVG
ncbi:helix-turn-helix domain-containing protein [Nocardioides sp. QY071]|uniref:helix-turn-helix domain-containing protein n=1 Tax=Nocardioides sp. QY071 TaxID=3044187 RepID=UPI00249A5B33|nr:helix-turn-helix domain-containing protein [Nocardioides sp. QY071]WGY04319.1 helix-turn-helix domain-containing protein [Nocardioides sp. QY071]